LIASAFGLAMTVGMSLQAKDFFFFESFATFVVN